MNWTPRDYDRLERAIADGTRIQVMRGGSRQVLLPQRLRTEFGTEMLAGRHMGTGDRFDFPLEEIETFDVLG